MLRSSHAHAPGRFERLLFGFAGWYLGLLARTRLGLRFLRGLGARGGRGLPGRDAPARPPLSTRTPRPQRNTPRRGSWRSRENQRARSWYVPAGLPLLDQDNGDPGLTPSARGESLWADKASNGPSGVGCCPSPRNGPGCLHSSWSGYATGWGAFPMSPWHFMGTPTPPERCVRPNTPIQNDTFVTRAEACPPQPARPVSRHHPHPLEVPGWPDAMNLSRRPFPPARAPLAYARPP